jgi:uncharacterized protein (DUF488 family)
LSVIYTFGYEKRSVDELAEEAYLLDAVVVDVRIRPFSRAKGWSRRNLEIVLGDHYLWVREFGNKNYKGGPTELVDVKAGLEIVAPLIAEGRDLILLCYEADPADCHRTDVAEAIAARFGGEINHLVRGNPPSQPALFQF